MATILIVDDDADLLRALTLLLTHAGHRVITAQDGVLATTAAARHRPDMVILDLGLPGGSGLTVLERMQAAVHLSAVPVLVLTGSTDPQCEAQILKAGAREFLRKPADPQILLAAVGRLTAHSQAA